MKNYMPNGFEFDPSIRKSITNIKEEIQKEEKNDKPDKERITKLKMEKLLKSMQISSNSLYTKNYRSMYPW